MSHSNLKSRSASFVASTVVSIVDIMHPLQSSSPTQPHSSSSPLIGVSDMTSVLVQCFSLIFIGYVSGRLKLIKETESKGLSAFVTYFSLPALIFHSLATSDLSNINWYFVSSLLISKTIIFFAVVVITAILTKPSNLGKSGLFAIFSTQSNDFALGYPLLISLYGSSKPEFARYLYVLAPIQLVILNPIGLFLMETHRHRRSQNFEGHHYCKIFVRVFKQIVKNPIIFMTLIGIVWNQSFSHQMPQILRPLLEVLSNSFSATALFLLGLNLVGKFKCFAVSSHILTISLVLVMTKILILPLMNRVVIQNMMVYQNEEALELSNFGFLYGTFPSAPTAFIFALQYEFGISSIIVSAAMVLSTVLSAPLMFVSANMIRLTNNSLPVVDFHNDLGQTMFYSGLVSALCVLWTILVFICGRKWRSLTHRCTVALALSQLMVGIGGYLWSDKESSESWRRHFIVYHIQYVLAVGGILSSRIWTAMLAITLALLRWKNLCYVINIHNRLSYLLSSVTIILFFFIIYWPNYPDPDSIDPNFEFGSSQAYIVVAVLVFSLISTIISLILQQHFRSRSLFLQSLSINSEDIESEPEDLSGTEHHTVIVHPSRRRGRNRTTSTNSIASDSNTFDDFEDMASDPNQRDFCQNNCSQERRKTCITHVKRYRDQISEANEVTPLIQRQNSTNDATDEYHQFSHHVFLCLTLLLSMMIGLTVSVGKLLLEKPTGILIELEFLDILLNYGQGVITFLIFGIETSPVFTRIWHLITSGNENSDHCIVLPPIDQISAETKHICDNFITFHRQQCVENIVFQHNFSQSNFCYVFRGKDLVDWLIRTRISSNRTDAELYGKHLLTGRVIQHLNLCQHFHDNTFLYKFI